MMDMDIRMLDTGIPTLIEHSLALNWLLRMVSLQTKNRQKEGNLTSFRMAISEFQNFEFLAQTFAKMYIFGKNSMKSKSSKIPKTYRYMNIC